MANRREKEKVKDGTIETSKKLREIRKLKTWQIQSKNREIRKVIVHIFYQ